MIEPITYQDGVLSLLDQRRLPLVAKWVTCRDAAEAAEAIAQMVVRGAPAIGVTAAYGLALEARAAADRPAAELVAALEAAGERLRAARPTAVNLGWAVDRVIGVARRALADGRDAAEIAERVEAEAQAIHSEDVEANRRLGRHGSLLVPDGARVMTHCNAGALATAGYGTALGVVRAAIEEGKSIALIANETRPFLQGARLTAYEMIEDRIPGVLIPDTAAGAMMARGEVDLVVVGADRIARNGDVANKIGTYQVAVLARRHGIPFYVAAPTSTIDPDCPDGDSIPIEERDPREVTHPLGHAIAPEGIEVRNIAFDVTPAELVTAIITEAGIARPPYSRSLARLLGLEVEEEDDAPEAFDADADTDPDEVDDGGEERAGGGDEAVDAPLDDDAIPQFEEPASGEPGPASGARAATAEPAEGA